MKRYWADTKQQHNIDLFSESVFCVSARAGGVRTKKRRLGGGFSDQLVAISEIYNDIVRQPIEQIEQEYNIGPKK